jgi:uncharacterized protein YbjT (DUF2867 family)
MSRQTNHQVAIVAGATGLTGNELIRQLVHHPSFDEVIALVRSPGRLGLQSEKFREIQLPPGGFLGSEAEALILPEGALYFCALGTTRKKAGSQKGFLAVDLESVEAFGRICEKHVGSCLVLVSSSGARTSSPIFYTRVKGLAEEKLKAMKIPRLVIFRPSVLIGERAESRPTEKIAIRAWRLFKPILPVNLARKLGTPISILVEQMVDESLDPREGRYVIEASEIG